MLPLYSDSAAELQFTVVYCGYDLDVTRALSGWRVGVHPKTADLPILGRSEIYAAVKYMPTTRTRLSLKPRVE
jgi:hypothetical protein